jgi:hypothetical protein
VFRLSGLTWGNRLGATDRTWFRRSVTAKRAPIADPGAPRSVDRAIDCWCHGVSHLLSALGPEAALSVMARTVVDLVDGNAGSPALPTPPGAA